MKENIVIIDGSSLLYRAFYAIPHLTDAQGHPTNAVYGFLNMLLKLYGELDPQYVAVAFDKSKHTFRNDLFDGYKATRKPAPDDLRPQFALIREVKETTSSVPWPGGPLPMAMPSTSSPVTAMLCSWSQTT